MEKKKIIVGTHDGQFHCDEVFAIAMLKELYEVTVVRTRDLEKLAQCDFRVDVGGKYDLKTNDFDHHQKSFTEEREGIPYSSCGLIWKHYGKKICETPFVHERIEKKLVRFIDAEDNGIDYANGLVNVYTLGGVIDSFNPFMEDGETNENTRFLEAVEFAQALLHKELEKSGFLEEGEKKMKEYMNDNPNHDYIIIPEMGLPKNVLIEDEHLLYMISPRKDDGWAITAVPKSPGSFENRKDLPAAWGGLVNEELEQTSGIKGARFCHKKLFFATNATKEGAIAMVKKALEE